MCNSNQFNELLTACKAKSTQIHQQFQAALSNPSIVALKKKYPNNVVIEDGQFNLEFRFRHLARDNNEESYSSDTQDAFHNLVSELRAVIRPLLAEMPDVKATTSEEYGTFSVSIPLPIDHAVESKKLLIESVIDPSLKQDEGDKTPQVFRDSVNFSAVKDGMRDRIASLIRACGLDVDEAYSLPRAVYFKPRNYS